MPRDVLLILVLVAVLLNLALLVAVGILRVRPTESPSRRQRQAIQHRESARSPGRPPAYVRRPAEWAPTGVRAVPVFGPFYRARPIAPPLAPPDAPEWQDGTEGREVSAVMLGPERPSTLTAPIPTMTSTLDEPPEATGQAEPAEAPASANGTEPGATRGELASRRGRRFVMPHNDEDRGRTERAIEAFLGEPAPSGSSSTHRLRRRARRQKPPGEQAGPLVLVAALGGFEQLRQTLGREGAVRFAEAYGEALRATLRSGDHVTDLGQGRLRLVVHADEEGARALMERARAVCEPWLRLAPVPLALRVRPMPEAGPADARRDGRSGDGRSDGQTPSGGAATRAAGRPDEAERRRLAAG